MFTKVLTIYFLTFVTLGYAVEADKFSYKKGLGYWQIQYDVTDPSGNVRNIPIADTSRSTDCTYYLNIDSPKIEQANGFFWTDKDYIMYSYVYQTDFIKHKVVALKCVYRSPTDKTK